MNHLAKRKLQPLPTHTLAAHSKILRNSNPNQWQDTSWFSVIGVWSPCILHRYHGASFFIPIKPFFLTLVQWQHTHTHTMYQNNTHGHKWCTLKINVHIVLLERDAKLFVCQALIFINLLPAGLIHTSAWLFYETHKLRNAKLSTGDS